MYRFLAFMFLFFIPAVGELVLSLMRPVTWPHRFWLYGPFVGLYLAAIVAPGLVRARILGRAGGSTLGPAPWNLVFKVYGSGLVGMLLVKLALNSRQETDPVARREKIALIIGGGASLAALWGLWRYGQVARANPSMARPVGAADPGELIRRPVAQLLDPGAAGPGHVARAVFTDIAKAKRAEREQEDLIDKLQEALVKAKTLRGLVPICASYKKIRDDKGFCEVYVRDRSEAEFSHGICPDCMARLYPALTIPESDSGQGPDN